MGHRTKSSGIMKLKNLMQVLFRPLIANKADRPDDSPNNWGRFEYQGEQKTLRARERIDHNNADVKLGWIEAYVIKRFEGLKVRGYKRKMKPQA